MIHVMHEPLLWCDVETNCLEEAGGYIFEIALALTDSDQNEVASTDIVIGWRDPWLLPLNDVARDMHTRNGLLEEVAASRVSLREAEDRFVAWIKEHDATGLYMAGRGPHFDRRWTRHQMPALERQFSHRNVDLTTLRYFFGAEKVEPPHRALQDLRASIDDLRRYVAWARSAGLLLMPETAVA